jgi:Rieske 2Fe-2S family protein
VSDRHEPLIGIFGAPFVDLEHLVTAEALAEVDAEITRGLSLVECGFTGGTLKWMGVVAPWARRDAYRDAMEVIRELEASEYATFLELAADPLKPEDAPQAESSFGDETDRPFSLAQMRWLSYRHGVYFPWRVCYHFLENERWEDKHSGEGKSFSEEAREVFPKTVALLESLPVLEIGRAVLFGLEPNDHAPLHRDTEPGRSLSVAQSISIAPRGEKRFFLQNAAEDPPHVVDKRVYWFNDMDYHGVLADPFFRYSIRVDGVFEPSFLQELERSAKPRSGVRRTLPPR